MSFGGLDFHSVSRSPDVSIGARCLALSCARTTSREGRASQGRRPEKRKGLGRCEAVCCAGRSRGDRSAGPGVLPNEVRQGSKDERSESSGGLKGRGALAVSEANLVA